jgi:imidazolonepropionase-like amidohydrolase
MRNGGDFLKVMSGGGVASEFDPIDLNSPSLEEMKAAVQAANEYGGYVAIHGYTDAAYNKSLDAGVKSFEHGFLISEETVKRMAKEGVWWSWQPYGSYNTFGMGNFPDWFTADMREKGALVAKGAVQVPKWMKKHGVKIFNGSDMFGWDNWHNAIVNVTYPVEIPGGVFTSLDAMKYSTSAAGQALQELSAPSRNPYKGAKLGVVEEGAWADILIWKGDPTQNVKLILEADNLLFIMKDGKSYKNLLVPPTHESYRGGLTPSGYSWSM